jgi:hypothetical protein
VRRDDEAVDSTAHGVLVCLKPTGDCRVPQACVRRVASGELRTAARRAVGGQLRIGIGDEDGNVASTHPVVHDSCPSAASGRLRCERAELSRPEIFRTLKALS